MANAWIEHVKEYALVHNIRYGDALRDPNCKSSYHGKSGGALGIKKVFKKAVKGTKDTFQDTKHYLGDTENRHYGKNAMKYINEVNKYTQAVAKPLSSVPVIGVAAKAVSGVSQAQTNLANNIYRDTKPKEKTYFLDKYDKKGGSMVDNPLVSTVAENEFYQLSKYNPKRQHIGGSFSSMGGSFTTMGGSFKSMGR